LVTNPRPGFRVRRPLAALPYTKSRGFRFISIITLRQLTSLPPPPTTPLFSSNPLSVRFCQTVSISSRAAKQFPRDSASLPTDDNRRMQKPASSLVAAKHPAIVNGKIKDRSKGEAPNIFKGKKERRVSVTSSTCTAGLGSHKKKKKEPGFSSTRRSDTTRRFQDAVERDTKSEVHRKRSWCGA